MYVYSLQVLGIIMVIFMLLRVLMILSVCIFFVYILLYQFKLKCQ